MNESGQNACLHGASLVLIIMNSIVCSDQTESALILAIIAVHFVAVRFAVVKQSINQLVR